MVEHLFVFFYVFFLLTGNQVIIIIINIGVAWLQLQCTMQRPFCEATLGGVICLLQ